MKYTVGFYFHFSKKGIDKFEISVIIHPVDAGVAHPVERHLAKVEVASSSLVARSIKPLSFRQRFFFLYATISYKLMDTPSSQQNTARCCRNPAAPLFSLRRDSLETVRCLFV